MGATTAPEFTLRLEAQEEADCSNVEAQAMIGAKEEVVEAIKTLVGPTSPTACYKPATVISKA